MTKAEAVHFEPVEKTLLQIAVKRMMGDLEAVSKKAKSLGVETTKAVEHDLNILKDLETKLL